MSKLLTGKIYWVRDDFSYIGTHIPKKDATSHIAARLENVIINEYMIKFYVCPHKDSNNDYWTYNVNLFINNDNTKYNGTFTEDLEPSYVGDVNLELFENKNKYFLYGRWIEEETIYTFWATIDKILGRKTLIKFNN